MLNGHSQNLRPIKKEVYYEIFSNVGCRDDAIAVLFVVGFRFVHGMWRSMERGVLSGSRSLPIGKGRRTVDTDDTFMSKT